MPGKIEGNLILEKMSKNPQTPYHRECTMALLDIAIVQKGIFVCDARVLLQSRM